MEPNKLTTQDKKMDDLNSPIYEPKRNAGPAVKGFFYQALCSAIHWYELKDEKAALFCEVVEDIWIDERTESGREWTFIQVKHIPGSDSNSAINTACQKLAKVGTENKDRCNQISLQLYAFTGNFEPNTPPEFTNIVKLKKGLSLGEAWGELQSIFGNRAGLIKERVDKAMMATPKEPHFAENRLDKTMLNELLRSEVSDDTLNDLNAKLTKAYEKALQELKDSAIEQIERVADHGIRRIDDAADRSTKLIPGTGGFPVIALTSLFLLVTLFLGFQLSYSMPSEDKRTEPRPVSYQQLYYSKAASKMYVGAASRNDSWIDSFSTSGALNPVREVSARSFVNIRFTVLDEAILNGSYGGLFWNNKSYNFPGEVYCVCRVSPQRAFLIAHVDGENGLYEVRDGGKPKKIARLEGKPDSWNTYLSMAFVDNTLYIPAESFELLNPDLDFIPHKLPSDACAVRATVDGEIYFATHSSLFKLGQVEPLLTINSGKITCFKRQTDSRKVRWLVGGIGMSPALRDGQAGNLADESLLFFDESAPSTYRSFRNFQDADFKRMTVEAIEDDEVYTYVAGTCQGHAVLFRIDHIEDIEENAEWHQFPVLFGSRPET